MGEKTSRETDCLPGIVTQVRSATGTQKARDRWLMDDDAGR